MVMAEDRWVRGGCDLWVVKVRNCEIAHGERMRGVCDGKNREWEFALHILLAYARLMPVLCCTYSWHTLWCCGEKVVVWLFLWICYACARAMFWWLTPIASYGHIWAYAQHIPHPHTWIFAIHALTTLHFLFYLSRMCIAYAQAERGPKLNLKFGLLR